MACQAAITGRGACKHLFLEPRNGRLSLNLALSLNDGIVVLLDQALELLIQQD
jgi:hypothetical protein